MQIKITLKSHKSTDYPSVKIIYNNNLYFDNKLSSRLSEIVLDIDTVNANNLLEIQHYNKSNSDTLCNDKGEIVADKAVELESISLDSFQIPKQILFKKKFYVEWPLNLLEEAKINGKKMPDYLDNNLFFGFNGTYKFDFKQEYKKEYFSYFWQMEKEANQTFEIIDSDGKSYFNAYGLRLPLDKDFSFTIHDLKYIIENKKLPD